jgi:hypothetical protein
MPPPHFSPYSRYKKYVRNETYLIKSQVERIETEEKLKKHLRNRLDVPEGIQHRRRLRKGQGVAGNISLPVPQGAPEDGERHAPRLIGSHVLLQLVHGPDVVKDELDHQHVGAEWGKALHVLFFLFLSYLRKE